MKLPFLEIANRVTGFSTPIFGLQWTPSTLDVDLARQLLTYLEDRRVLYVPDDREGPSYAVQSVLAIRQRLTDLLTQTDRSSPLGESVVAMRAACRKFLDRVQGLRLVSMLRPFHFEDMVFLSALGELRGVFGLHIARLAVLYGIDVEEDLASILPAPPDGE